MDIKNQYKSLYPLSAEEYLNFYPEERLDEDLNEEIKEVILDLADYELFSLDDCKELFPLMYKD